jgi:hypothetical protein
MAIAGSAVSLCPARASATQVAASETARLARVLAEARNAARRAAEPRRASLLEHIVREQSKLHDFAEAEQTLSLLAFQTAIPDTVTVLQRAGLQVLCGLLDLRRPADAARFVERIRSPGDREWLRASLASQTARGRGTPYTTSPRSEDVAIRVGKALEIAGHVSALRPRADALVAIAGVATAHTPSQASAAREAVLAVARLGDSDLRSARSAMLVEPLIESGELALARRQFDELRNTGDRAYVGWRLVLRVVTDTARTRNTARDALRDSLLRSVIAEAARTRANPASASLLRGFRSLLLQEKRRALADSLVADSLAPSDSEPALRMPGVRATETQAHSMRRNPGREARERIDQARAFSSNHDSAAAYLALARAALLGGAVDSLVFDELAVEIARAQFRLGEDEAGLATLDLVRDPRFMRYVVASWIGSNGHRLNVQRLRELANRARQPALRDELLLGLLRNVLRAQGSAPHERAGAIALVDSLTMRVARDEARVFLADDALARGDSAAARALYRSVLPSDDSFLSVWNSSPEMGLAKAGGGSDLLAWARSDVRPAVRARRLLRIAEIEQALMEASRRTVVISMGPDGCRDEF